jgi:hypothetical protein
MIHGVRVGVDLVLRRRSKSYENAILFLEYVNNIFIPYLNRLRESEQMKACEAIGLMDSWSPHVSVDIVAVLTNTRVRVIIFTTHTTHVFQMLDVVLFDALKKRTSRLEMWNAESGIVAFIIKLYHDFKQTMVKVNIRGAFRPLGSPITLPKILTDCSSMKRSSGKVAASWNSGGVTRPWRFCRRGVDRPNLNVLANPNKSVWSKKLAISSTGNKDMQLTG